MTPNWSSIAPCAGGAVLLRIAALPSLAVTPLGASAWTIATTSWYLAG